MFASTQQVSSSVNIADKMKGKTKTGSQDPYLNYNEGLLTSGVIELRKLIPEAKKNEELPISQTQSLIGSPQNVNKLKRTRLLH